MKKILTIITALVVCYNTAKAQIVFSDNRPESPVVVHQVQSQVDTVYVLTEAGIEKAVMVTTVYKIIYEKTGEHEGNQLRFAPLNSAMLPFAGDISFYDIYYKRQING